MKKNINSDGTNEPLLSGAAAPDPLTLLTSNAQVLQKQYPELHAELQEDKPSFTTLQSLIEMAQKTEQAKLQAKRKADIQLWALGNGFNGSINGATMASGACSPFTTAVGCGVVLACSTIGLLFAPKPTATLDRLERMLGQVKLVISNRNAVESENAAQTTAPTLI